jgi:outer membrane protein TolC
MLKAVLLSCLFASSVFAQVLTLDAVLREALQNNPGYLASRADRRYAENAHSSAGVGGYLPTASATGGLGWSKLDTRQERLVAGVTTTESVDGAESRTRNAGVNANWTLFEGFAAPLAQRRLRLQRDQARAAETLTREELLRRAALAYADLTRQARLRDVRDTLLRLSDERFRILSSRVASGSAARPDWLEGQVDRNADRAALIQQEALLYSARLHLAEAMGRDSAVQGGPGENSLPSGILDRSALRGGLENRQPELKLAEAERDLARVTLNEAMSPLYPRLEANAGYNFNLANNDAGIVRESRTVGPSAGLQLTLNLFDGELPWRVRARGRHALTTPARGPIRRARGSRPRLRGLDGHRLGRDAGTRRPGLRQGEPRPDLQALENGRPLVPRGAPRPGQVPRRVHARRKHRLRGLPRAARRAARRRAHGYPA